MAATSATAELPPGESQLSDLCLVLADDLAMLAVLHDKEPSVELLELVRRDGFPTNLGFKLIGELGSEALELMQRALTALPAVIDQATLDELAADYASIYLNYSIQASPEESVWVDEEHLACQAPMFQVRAWFNRYGLEAADWRIRPDDHLVLQLQFIEQLLRGEQSVERLREVTRFMDEHLLRWLMPFAERVGQRGDTLYFAAVAFLTGTYCEEVRDLLSDILGEPRPSSEEIEQRMGPRQQAGEVPLQFMPGTGPEM